VNTAMSQLLTMQDIDRGCLRMHEVLGNSQQTVLNVSLGTIASLAVVSWNLQHVC